MLWTNDPALVKNLIVVVDHKFSLKDLSLMDYFFGIQVTHVDDLLPKLKLTSLKSAPTPSFVGKHYSISSGLPLANPFVCRSTIGVLQYLPFHVMYHILLIIYVSS